MRNNQLMTIGNLLKEAIKRLKDNNGKTRLLRQVFLSHNGKDQSYIYAHPDYVLNDQSVEKYISYIKRRDDMSLFIYYR